MAQSIVTNSGVHLPNFLVAGTAKAGTTSLAYYLGQHPEIEIPVKETFYFNAPEFKYNYLPYPSQRKGDDIIRTPEAYTQLYESCRAPCIGEVGTGYLYHHKVSIPRIKKTLGNEIPIFIVLRNPIERAYSAFMHFKKDCFEDISFAEALEMECYRVEQHWDFMWHYKAMGFYFEQVQAYQRHFSNVKVFLHEDLKARPEKVLSEVFQQLGVSPFSEINKQIKNPSGDARYPWLQRLITHENPVKKLLRPVLRMLINDQRRAHFRKYVKSKNLKPSEAPDSETLALLRNTYRSDVLRLSDLIQKDLSHWIDEEH